MKRRERREPNYKLNLWISRIIPLLLLGIIGYAAWVVTKRLCVDYLLQPPLSILTRKQTGAAIAILTIFYILMISMLVCYGRLLDAVIRTPGLVPRGRQWYTERARRNQGKTSNGRSVNEEKLWDSESARGSSPATASSNSFTQHNGELRVEDFWKRDVFSCKYDGRPDFCSTCYNWKPDRSHHCSELNRCVLKMDHFCPWVGGVVGETSFKFFIQFTFWTALFCLHTLVSFAYFVAQRNHREGTVDVHWAVVLGLATLFFLFTSGMCMSSAQFAFISSTTIENISRRSKVWYLAIYIPDHMLPALNERETGQVRLITYPRPLNEQLQILEQNGAVLNPEAPTDASAGITAPMDLPQSSVQRTFGIFATRAGEIPWSVGPASNFMDVMGYRVWDWFLPIHRSPCTMHTSTESFYKVGPVVDRIKEEAGLVDNQVLEKRRTKSRRKRHRTRHTRTRSRPDTRA